MTDSDRATTSASPPASGTSVLPPPPRPPAPDAAGLPSSTPMSGRKVRPRPPDPSPGRLLLLALVGGLAFDLGLRGGFGNALVSGGLAVVALGLATGGRLANPQARGLALTSLVPAGLLALRSSPWLLAADLGAALLLIGAAVAWGSGGSAVDAGLGDVVRRWGRALPFAWSAPRVLQPLVPRVSGEQAERGRAVLRAAVIALPVLVVVVALLASADAVFAALLTPDVGVNASLSHLVLAGTAALAIVMVVGSAAATGSDAPRKGTFATIEIVTMLSLAVAVLGAFSVAQVLALTGAGDRAVASSGLTPAEYARSGFFQLCWATGILVAFLAAVRALARPDVFADRRVRVLAALAPLLTTGLVVVSLRRMALYDAAFGFTMLRLAVVAVTIWLGLTLVFMALRNLGLAAHREWLVGASAVTALAIVAVANLANPEAFVVRHNLDRADRGESVDISYLAELSDDAVPAIAEARDRIADVSVRIELERALRCEDDRTGTAAWNLAVSRARAARAEPCRPAS